MPFMVLAIENKKGLHARAAAKFVKCAADFEATEIRIIGVERNGQLEETAVSATSVLGLLMLAAEQGSLLHVHASGSQADQALIALKSLLADKFHEGE